MTRQFSQRLLQWYQQNGRHDLPWQKKPTAYRIWVSEIMLQQTQVKTVIPYFNSFLRHFPDVKQLALADLNEVLHFWSGLGYYARARNLHKAAKLIVENHAGKLPDTYDDLIQLPGIGRSTAGAILALAHNRRYPILDGNVKRILARHEGISGWPGQGSVSKLLWSVATSRTPDNDVADYTQAIMDLGATICSRTQPLCNKCPVVIDCYAFINHCQADLPSRKPTGKIPVRETVFIMLKNQDGEIFLQQRPPSGIWGGLWSFPESSNRKGRIVNLCLNLGFTPDTTRHLPILRHTFSHYHLDILPVLINVSSINSEIREEQGIWYFPDGKQKIGLAAPVKVLLDQIKQEPYGVMYG